ncbi:hypothetical protein D8674_020815 [Pyrus ussuriensis x Pyrus communis]|nr:hypothetical protein D8674_020815 [Pyrus ussuriensis x Pyrus communis]
MSMAGWPGKLPPMGYGSVILPFIHSKFQKSNIVKYGCSSVFSVITVYHLFEKSGSCRNYNSSSCWDSRWMKRSGVILKSDPSAYVLLFKPYGQPLFSIKVDQ